MSDCPFDRLGPATPESPIVLAVPHAGRRYPDALIAALRVPLAAATALEDRLVDAVAIAARRRETLFVANRPRAWIDLNRAETERDPRIEEGFGAMALPFLSAKVRGGLGLIPRRVAAAGDLWARRLTAAEVHARIVSDHRPWHSAIGEELAATRARFGIAVLIDIHSMPPLREEGAAQLVIGDRFGRSASARLVARAEHAARSAGLRTALNTPYAGGHTLDRHGDPRHGVHAVQIEIDRSLYLDDRLAELGPGFERAAQALGAIIAAIADEAAPHALAAE